MSDDAAFELRCIEACRAGDAEAFTPLVERHRRRVFRLAYGVLRNAEDAEDAAQEAFMKAYQALDRFDASRPFGAWILAIASRTAIDRLRRRRTVAGKADGIAEYEGATRAPHAPSADDEASRNETRAALQVAFDSLGGRMRAVLWLKDVEGYETEEVAATLDIDPATVRVHLFKARAKLRKMLRGLQPGAKE